jgi:uncharacterized protein YfaS (alpha-2-macroglobulin family)
VRLDTYSGAPVDFSAYLVDPAEVIIAGQNRAPRPLDTARRKPVVRWRFSPPRGQLFESSDVVVPIGSDEGFFVIEARRGDAVQQVWINRTHIGLLTKVSPEGLLVWAVDLRTGRPVPSVGIEFLVGTELVDRKTDANGFVVWRDLAHRPVFALAEANAARAFVSILPQAPPAGAVVGIRLESAAARAGSPVHFAGFARRRSGGVFKPASGEVRVSLSGDGRTLAATMVTLDAAGAFDGSLDVPSNAEAGDYAVLATAAAGVGGTSVHVDAAADVALAITNPCPCDPTKGVVPSIVATRAGAPAPGIAVQVDVVRTPHIVPPSGDESVRWGTTVVYSAELRTGSDGRAKVTLAAPTDGLDSTYGIRATTAGATATARIAVPNARIALDVEPAAAIVDPGQPVAFDVRGFNAIDGAPAPGANVHLHLSHGSTFQDQDVQLDARGYARAIFRDVSLGSNLALADATVDGRRILDATTVTVEPSALSVTAAADAAAVTIALDAARYRVGGRITVRAEAPGAIGDALITLEGARTYVTRVGVTAGGVATATLDLGDPQGDVRVSAAFVRNGAIAVGSIAVPIDGPGHPRLTEVALDRAAYGPGESARATIHDGDLNAPATYAIRIADGLESGPALFDDASAVLASGGTTSQNPASENPTWHAYVAPASSKASDIFAAEQPTKVSTDLPTLGVAAPHTMLWRVERNAGETFDVVVPKEPGHYILSVMKISDNGCVGAASTSFDVR